MKQTFTPKLDFNYVGVEISSNITVAMAKEQRRFVDQVTAYAGSHQGVYIVLEGADLTGKSSQCWNILKLLRDNTNLSIQLVEEPGGTPRADEIRRLVKDKSSHLSPTETGSGSNRDMSRRDCHDCTCLIWIQDSFCPWTVLTHPRSISAGTNRSSAVRTGRRNRYSGRSSCI